MKRCDKIEIKISAYLDGEITASEWQQVETHIHTCARCANTLRAFQQTTNVFQRDLHKREPSQAVWNRIHTRLQSPRRSSGKARLLNWLEGIKDRLASTGAPTRRFALAGCALATVLVLIVLYEVNRPDRADIAGPTIDGSSEAASESVAPPAFDPMADKQRFVQASMVQQIQNYFEKTGVLLLEVKNSEAVADPEALREIRKNSEDLLEETILIKQSLKNSELTVLMKTIGQLEMLLFDAANLNEEPDTDDLNLLKATILQNDLLIKIEIYDAKELDPEVFQPETRQSMPESPKRQI